MLYKFVDKCFGDQRHRVANVAEKIRNFWTLIYPLPPAKRLPSKALRRIINAHLNLTAYTRTNNIGLLFFFFCDAMKRSLGFFGVMCYGSK